MHDETISSTNDRDTLQRHIRSGHKPVVIMATVKRIIATWIDHNRRLSIQWIWRYGQWLWFLLGRWARIEEPRLALFVPVLMGIGIGIYFSLGHEPPFASGLVLTGIFGLLILTKLRQRWPYRLLILAGLFISIGFTATIIRTHFISAPVLDREIDFADITGRLISIEERATGRRLIIAPTMVEGLAPKATPAKIRLNWRGKNFAVRAGDHIRLRAGLSPPPPPVIPGGYDFARHLYFQKIGAVGYVVASPEKVPKPPTSAFGQATLRVVTEQLELIRTQLFHRITNASPGDGGAILAAIVTGKREAISQTAQASLRDSGLAHLIAISGLHMGLATGLIFFGARFLMALWPTLALTQPIKKWAALAALGSGTLYLLLSGSGWSARRAFIMTSILFIAVLTDRRAFSLRNVAVAATLILFLTPEALLHPGFQMSFAAVTALVAAYEWISHRKIDQKTSHTEGRNLLRQIRKYALGIAATDTIAALATAPFALYHFHRTALYSLPANMAAMPLMGFWIMPTIIIALVMMPFGIDGFFWRIAAHGIDVILAIGAYVSALPGAISLVAQQNIAWLVILSGGGIILCLLKAPWRVAGLIAIPIACLMMILVSEPHFLISGKGQNVAMLIQIDGDKQFAVYDRRRDRFSTRVWMESLGLQPEAKKPLRMEEVFPCDSRGCVISLPIKQSTVKTIAVSAQAIGLTEDCKHADIVIALYPVNRRLAPNCHAQLLDRRQAWNDGARAIWFDRTGTIRIRSIREVRGQRPWSHH